MFHILKTATLVLDVIYCLAAAAAKVLAVPVDIRVTIWFRGGFIPLPRVDWDLKWKGNRLKRG
jgi:hypothetical protein